VVDAASINTDLDSVAEVFPSLIFTLVII